MRKLKKNELRLDSVQAYAQCYCEYSTCSCSCPCSCTCGIHNAQAATSAFDNNESKEYGFESQDLIYGRTDQMAQ